MRCLRIPRSKPSKNMACVRWSDARDLHQPAGNQTPQRLRFHPGFQHRADGLHLRTDPVQKRLVAIR